MNVASAGAVLLVQRQVLQLDLSRDALLIGGVVIGLLLGIPLVTFTLTGRHRWLAILALNACYVLAFLIGGWEAAGAAVLASVLALVVSAALLRHLFDDSTWEALYYQLELAFGRNKGIQVIEQGQTVVPAEGGQLLGPRMVIIRPENAVILERGGQQTRVSGPRILKSEPFEYVRRIYDLRPHQEWLSLSAVPTADLMAVDVTAHATYRIDIPEACRLGREPFTPQQDQVVQQIDLRAPEWERATKGVVEGHIRRLIGAVEMHDLMRNGVLQRMEHQALRLANEQCGAWHVVVDTLILERVQPVAEATAGMAGRARAAAQRDALRLMADGYQQARDRGMTDDEIQYEVLRHTLEQIAKDSSTELLLTPEYQDLASILRQNRNHQGTPRTSEQQPAQNAAK